MNREHVKKNQIEYGSVNEVIFRRTSQTTITFKDDILKKSTEGILIISIGQVRHIYVMMKSTFKQQGQRLTFLLLTSKKKISEIIMGNYNILILS